MEPSTVETALCRARAAAAACGAAWVSGVLDEARRHLEGPPPPPVPSPPPRATRGTPDSRGEGSRLQVPRPLKPSPPRAPPAAPVLKRGAGRGGAHRVPQHPTRVLLRGLAMLDAEAPDEVTSLRGMPGGGRGAAGGSKHGMPLPASASPAVEADWVSQEAQPTALAGRGSPVRVRYGRRPYVDEGRIDTVGMSGVDLLSFLTRGGSVSSSARSSDEEEEEEDGRAGGGHTVESR